MRVILNIILILIVVSTISICAVKPNMHKNIIVYDSAYKLVEEKVAEMLGQEHADFIFRQYGAETSDELEARNYKAVFNDLEILLSAFKD